MTQRTNTLWLISAIITIALTTNLASFAKDKTTPLKWNERAIELKNSNAPREQQQTKAPTIDANGAITSPAGDKLDYSMSYYLVDAWGISAVGGEKAEIYYDNSSSTVYIKRLFEEYMGTCYYAQGRIIEGDLENGIVEFSTQSPIYYCYGTLLYIGIAEINETQDGFNYLEDRDTFQFDIKDGVWTCSDCLALIDKNDIAGGAYWVQYDYRYIPINLEEMTAVSAPANASSSHYFCANGTTDLGIVKIYNEGNDFYFNNIFGYGYTFKGTLNADNQIEIELPQLVSADDYFIYLNSSDISGNPKNSAKVIFQYDEESGDIYSPTDNIALFSGNRFLYGNVIYEDLEFTKFLPEEEPTEVPTGLEQRRYFMSTGYDLQGNHKGALMRIAKDGNDIYFMRADNTNYDVIIKGELNPEDNTVFIDLNQIIGVSGSRFIGIAAAKQYIVEVEDAYDDPYNEIRYTIDEEKTSITMRYSPETEIYTCDDVLAIIDAQRRILSFSYITPEYTPVNELYEVPETATINEYVFTPAGDTNKAKVIEIARDGNDFYFIHDKDRIFYGRLNDDGIITVKVPQLIGNGNNEQGVFLRTGESVRIYTPEDVDLQVRSWKQWFDDENIEELKFNYNEGLNQITCEGKFSFVTLSNGYELESADNFTYTTYLKGLFTPASPTDLSIADKKEDYWGNQQRYCFSFVIPCKDENGIYLPYDNISYSLYYDDEIFTFTPDEYPNTFVSEVTEVPFNHPATNEITYAAWNENMRRVYLYNLPQNKLGVRSIYTYEGEQRMSEISYIDIESAGISAETMDAKEVNATEYFDLSGRRITRPTQGIFIEKTIYTDGSTVTKKIIK